VSRPASRNGGISAPGRTALLVGLLLGALALRPQIVGVGPLIPRMQDDLDASHAVVGLLATIPVLCMGLFAPPAGFIASRFGTRRAIGVAILMVGVFGVLRTVVPSAWLAVVLTWPVGIGMGVAGALVPVAIKERLGARPAAGTGAYTTGIQIGSFTAALIVVPVADLVGGWRFSLGLLSALSIVFGIAWFRLVEDVPRPTVRVRPPRLPWASPTAWLLVATFACMALSYYGINAWLPDAYVEDGWSERSAGFLLAVSNVMAIPASFLVPLLSDRVGRRQPFLVVLSCQFLVCTALLLLAPGGAWVWALLLGFAQGGMFALVLTLPLDFEDRPDRVGALIAMELGLGYTIGAASPFLLGAVRDHTGSFHGVLWSVVGVLGVLVLCVSLLPLARRAGPPPAAA
jgi:MFS transporter, CP family, cyanate transporter